MQTAITGIGVACGEGFGKKSFVKALFQPTSLFSYLTRPGRLPSEGSSPFLGIELPEVPLTHLPARVERTLSLPSRVAILTLREAWEEAGLDRYNPERIGLVVGGSGLMAREQELAILSYQNRKNFIPPRMGHMFLDTEIAAVLTSCFPIRGVCETVNAASASGSAAVIQAGRHVEKGVVDVCIALGAMQDVSGVNLHTFRNMGSMGGVICPEDPGKAYRPMSKDSDGFVYGESCAALVVEHVDEAQSPYGLISGSASFPDGGRGPQPNSLGQQKAALRAISQAGLTPQDIDYINGHATGTPLGDKTEIATYRALGLDHAWTNTTKSIIGHGLSSAGAIELAAVLIQMREDRLHPSRNLEFPLDSSIKFTSAKPLNHRIKHALKFSFGFGGINTALAITAP